MGGWLGGRPPRSQAAGPGCIGPIVVQCWYWAHHVEHGEEDRKGEAHALGEDLFVEKVEANVQRQPRDQYNGGGN